MRSTNDKKYLSRRSQRPSVSSSVLQSQSCRKPCAIGTWGSDNSNLGMVSGTHPLHYLFREEVGKEIIKNEMQKLRDEVYQPNLNRSPTGTESGTWGSDDSNLGMVSGTHLYDNLFLKEVSKESITNELLKLRIDRHPPTYEDQILGATSSNEEEYAFDFETNSGRMEVNSGKELTKQEYVTFNDNKWTRFDKEYKSSKYNNRLWDWFHAQDELEKKRLANEHFKKEKESSLASVWQTPQNMKRGEDGLFNTTVNLDELNEEWHSRPSYT